MVIVADSTTGQVYDFLLALLKGVSYPGIVYDPNTRLRSVLPDQPIASIELNEDESEFEISRPNRRGDYLDHTRWTWKAILVFNREVDFTNLRTTLQTIPHLSPTTRIKLQRARYIHPPRQEANTGSRVDLLFSILLHPV